MKNFLEKKPKINSTCFIHKSSKIIGNVLIGKNSSVWPNVVIRGDINYIKIGKNTNIQDNSTIHVGKKSPVNIGNNISIGHNCVVHGCTIKNNCIIGMGAILLNRSFIGENSIVAAGSVLTENKIFPKNSLILGIPAIVKRKLNKKDIEKIKDNFKEYLKLAKHYKKRRKKGEVKAATLGSLFIKKI
jgi:carbonic anhydrase/acetyltransferase-like protein (isoleucine patch superfamily)